ncbi:unnamed protein product [Chondrus crispus]|uniref:Peptidase S54 rhomboid domain-containing protein n=1 Tax=Chondrus crispus TaxID=2769 RepID=R7Q9I5_CHOCR|nr:unnamed protein product [Chondrus crispus]CDF34719.1 unnamed protein product [Chondrus crispus]|eukprot:XP_005714538.1 unnamed protein product [Chondrus crispus]
MSRGGNRVVTLTEYKLKMLEAIGSPRLLTLFIATVCVVLYLAQAYQARPGAICLSPSKVFTQLAVYRIFTSPFFHGGLFHILFNTIAWMIIGRDYERTIGTLAATYSIFVLLIPLIAILHCSAAYLIDALAQTSFRNECAIGLSGVLFAILVVNVEVSPGTSVNVFGFFSMPKRWYPWALAAILQLLSPRLSILGHLSGIVLGYALVYGYLNRLSPSDYKLEDFEITTGLASMPLWQPLTTSTGMPVAGASVLPQTTSPYVESGSAGRPSPWSQFTSWFSSVFSGGNDRPFAGQGRPLGSGDPSATGGRVPQNSRLIREAGSQSTTTKDSSAEETEKNVVPEADESTDPAAGLSQDENKR